MWGFSNDNMFEKFLFSKWDINKSIINDIFLLSIFKNKFIIVSFIFMNILEGMIGGIMVCYIC